MSPKHKKKNGNEAPTIALTRFFAANRSEKERGSHATYLLLRGGSGGASAALGSLRNFDFDGRFFRARTALRLLRLLLAVRRLLADESTLRLGAVGRAVTLPVADWLLADGLTLRFRVGALGVA